MSSRPVKLLTMALSRFETYRPLACASLLITVSLNAYSATTIKSKPVAVAVKSAPARVAKLTKQQLKEWEANGIDQGTATTGVADQTNANTKGWSLAEMTNPNNRMYGYDGAIAFERNVPDPAGGAKGVNFHRIRPHYANQVGGHRSEITMEGGVQKEGVSYWFACAFYIPALWAPTMLYDDRQVLWQWHGLNDLPPSLGLQFNGDTDTLVWKTVGEATGGNDVWLHEEARTVPRNQWIKYIVHYKKGGPSPILEIWRGFGSGAVTYTKIVTYTKSFGWLGVDDWHKQGFYKWTMNSYGTSPDRVLYTYGEYMQAGDSLFENAVASLEDL